MLLPRKTKFRKQQRGRRSGPTVGVRYDFQALAALKLQTSHLRQTTRPTMNRFDAQISFMF